MNKYGRPARRPGVRLAMSGVGIAAMLAACSAPESTQQERDALARSLIEQKKTTEDATSTATTVDGYKVDLAKRISQVNFTSVYVERPQALLRSVIVIKYVVDGDGNLVKSEILRSNRDKHAEASALGSLKSAAPFPSRHRRCSSRATSSCRRAGCSTMTAASSCAAWPWPRWTVSGKPCQRCCSALALCITSREHDGVRCAPGPDGLRRIRANASSPFFCAPAAVCAEPRCPSLTRSFIDWLYMFDFIRTHQRLMQSCCCCSSSRRSPFRPEGYMPDRRQRRGQGGRPDHHQGRWDAAHRQQLERMRQVYGNQFDSKIFDSPQALRHPRQPDRPARPGCRSGGQQAGGADQVLQQSILQIPA
jgi:protein TonB